MVKVVGPVGMQVLLLCLHEHACHVHQLAVPRGRSGVWGVDKGCRGWLGVGYRVGSLNVDNPCRHDGVRGISKSEWRILLNGSIKVLGASVRGDAVGYPGGAPHEQLVRCRRRWRANPVTWDAPQSVPKGTEAIHVEDIERGCLGWGPSI